MVANTIGAGVYTTSGFTLADMGTPRAVLAVWLLAALLALSGALSFAALSKAIPLSGGEYLFLSRLFHPAAGFIAGWVSLLAGFAGSQAYGALAMADYMSLSPTSEKVIEVAVLIGLAATHGLLVRLGTGLQNLAVGLKALFLGGFILLGWFALPETVGHTAAVASTSSGFWVWPYNVLMVGLSYSGYNAAIYVAEECEAPRRDIPRALFWGTAITTVIYLCVNWVFLYSAPVEALKGVPDIANVAAQAIGGPALGKAVRVLVLLSLFTLLSGSAVAGPRVVQKMGEDGYLPPFTLGQASAIQCALSVLMVLNSTLLKQLGYLSLMLALVEALTVATIFRLPKEDRPALLFPLIFLGGTALTTAASLQRADLTPVYWAIGSVVSGLAAFYLVRWHNGRVEGAA